jgi:AAA-like domain
VTTTQSTQSINSPYQIGGSLPPAATTYVARQADQQLYQALLQSEFCYVFNARQMGKSSLRVQTTQRLRAADVHCGAIDLTTIGTRQVTPEQWYASFAGLLVSQFQLPIQLGQWWRARAEQSFVSRLSELVETVLLVEVTGPIVIFIDEVDSVLGLSFETDDFFAWIRSCYNQRSENPAYQRLSFAMLGVTTPSSLMQDKTVTPFNIGRSIELGGFQFVEALPLLSGLMGVRSGGRSQPSELLNQILSWTGGQPFLTQKLCSLVLQHMATPDCEVGTIVGQYVIQNWESQDEPEHLRTIRDRLLHRPDQAWQLITLYQKLLVSPQGQLRLDGSPVQRELLLSGLVYQKQDFIAVKNPIYEAVFNVDWIDQQLASLDAPPPPPSSPVLPEVVLPEEVILPEVVLPTVIPQKKPYLAGILGSVLLLGILGLGILRDRQQSQQISELRQAQVQADRQAATALGQQGEWLPALFHMLRADQVVQELPRDQLFLQQAIRSQFQQLVNQANDADPNRYPKIRLKQDLPGIKPGIKPDRDATGQTLLTITTTGKVQLRTPSGKLLHTVVAAAGPIQHLAVHPQQLIFATSSHDTVDRWQTDGKRLAHWPLPSAIRQLRFNGNGKTLFMLLETGQVYRWDEDSASLPNRPELWLAGPNPSTQLAVSPNNNELAIGDAAGNIQLYDDTGKPLSPLTGDQTPLTNLTFNAHGDQILSATATAAYAWPIVIAHKPQPWLRYACQRLRPYLQSTDSALSSTDRQRCAKVPDL